MVKAAAASVLFVLTKYSSLERATKVGYIVHMYMYKKYIQPYVSNVYNDGENFNKVYNIHNGSSRLRPARFIDVIYTFNQLICCVRSVPLYFVINLSLTARALHNLSSHNHRRFVLAASKQFNDTALLDIFHKRGKDSFHLRIFSILYTVFALFVNTISEKLSRKINLFLKYTSSCI